VSGTIPLNMGESSEGTWRSRKVGAPDRKETKKKGISCEMNNGRIYSNERAALESGLIGGGVHQIERTFTRRETDAKTP